MGRPLRIEFAGALYHVTARGNAREKIYSDDDDREVFLELLNNACKRHDWYCHAYCLMGNHYHLLVETCTPSLSKGMKYINGCYTKTYNRRYERAGHIFQGRYKAIHVEKQSYLLELARYIVLNPVRAHMVRTAKDWKWSSYRETAGYKVESCCLTTDWLLLSFSEKKRLAQERYRSFIQVGKNEPSPWESLTNEIYLGSDEFVEDMQSKLDPEQSLKGIPSKQKRAVPKSLSYYENRYNNRKQAMALAYLSGHYTLYDVGEYFDLSYATVSRAVKFHEAQRCNSCQM